jgi:murein L,D-transpeptidase YcbB/YkuD
MKANWIVLSVLLIGAASFATWRYVERSSDHATSLIRERIDRSVRHRVMPTDAPWRDRRAEVLTRAFYKQRHMAPAWTSGSGPTNAARELAAVVAHAQDEGLEPEEYSSSAIAARREEGKDQGRTGADPRSLAEFDLMCTLAAFHYMSDVSDGRISPKALDAEWVAKPRRGDLDSLLADAIEHNRVGRMLEALPPAQDGYRALRTARATYARIVAAGGWRAVPAGGPLRPGQHGRRVDALRARLVATGDLAASAGATGAYDVAVEKAVRRYQARIGHDPDGVVRPDDTAELNVPAAYRLQQIELNMERWRWVPRSFGERYLLVNIPEYALHIFEGSRSVLDMRVVVGKALTATPVFSDRMTHVVFNPTWSVPKSIAQGEMAAAVQEDPEYLAKHHIRVFDRDTEGAKEVDASTVDWADTVEVGRVRLQQDEGDDNALGRIKFLFPNRFDVYLHDTPAGELFAREDRNFSHGCVRVEDPVALAEYVLRGSSSGSAEQIQRLIDAGATTAVPLPQALPVHIVYFTAFVATDGSVGFRKDVYGIDADEIQQLRGRSQALAGR